MSGFKRILTVCVMMLCVFCTGCTSKESFSFAYKLEKTEFTIGERFELKTEITNTSGRNYKYEGAYSSFEASVKLYCNAEGKAYVLQYEPHADTSDVGKYMVKDGETRSSSYYFTIPADAPAGEYDLELSYDGNSTTYKKVVVVVE